MQYVHKRTPIGNWMAEAGTIGHEIFELVSKGELPPEQAKAYFEEQYNERIKGELPSWERKWFAESLLYFESFNGFEHDPIWVEEKISVEFPLFNLTGYVDLLHKEAGGFVITDHKISNPFAKKTLKEKLRQMYLYAFAVEKEFGQFPVRLDFNFFRKNEVMRIDFDHAEAVSALAWATDTVKLIETEKKFDYNPDHFFCKNLCNFRKICKFGDR